MSSMALVCKLCGGHSILVGSSLFAAVEKVCVGWEDEMDDKRPA
jgi:hypothetical protein